MNLRSRVSPWFLFWFCALSLTLWWFWTAADRASRQYLESAELRWEKEDYIGAIGDYEKIVEEYPRSQRVSEANYWKGVAYFLYLDNDQKAITSFNESIRGAVSPPDKAHALEVQYKVGVLYFDLGDLEQARVEWDILAKKDPRNKWAPVALYRGGGYVFYSWKV